MKISVIDVGSNSVRLATLADGKTLYKRLCTTRLGEGLSLTGKLSCEAIKRTAEAVNLFCGQASKDGAERVYVFATAAVRSSVNGNDFVKYLKDNYGIEVDVISGEQEAEIGALGALGDSDGGIIDIGGASTEITLRKGGKIIYSKSVDIGTVRLHDLAQRNKALLEKVIAEKIEEYGNLKAEGIDMYAIGGTASRLASIKCGLTEYRPEITSETKLTVAMLETCSDMLLEKPVEEIRNTTICKTSADIMGGGCLLLTMILKKIGVKEVTVSEADNIEGYYLLKEGVK